MRASWLARPWHLRVAALVLAAALVWLTRALAPGAWPLVEEGVGDLGWRIAARPQIERRVVIVDIDERSVAALGAWPWPRQTVAQLVTRLQEAGVAVQALDIVFPEAKPGDDELALALRRAPVVLGQIFSLDPAAAPEVGQATGAVAASCPPGLPQSSGLVGNAQALLAPELAGGHLTPAAESDGVVRRIPALICHAGKPYATLALAALARAAGPAAAPGPLAARLWRLHSALSGGERFPGGLEPPLWLSSPSLPGIAVPLDEAGYLRVPYGRQREALLSVSAADVLAGNAERQVLGGALAIVGATAFGIGDTVSTPLSAVASGVEVHAQLAAGLLDGRVVYTPQSAPWIAAGLLAATAALLLVVTARRRPAAGQAAARHLALLPTVGVVLALALAGLGAAAPSQWNLWLPWSAAALFALFGAVMLALAEHALTRAQRERLSAHLGAYLPAPMAARLAAIDPSGHLEADRRNVTVLVADIRNFSAYAAHRPAEQTAAVLHAFSCIAVEVVERHGGVVENIVGDQVLAMWNAYGGAAAPAPAEDARRALDAARDLLLASHELLAAAPADGQEASAVQPLALGIGLECGDAIVGSFGPARRRTHAALGEPVTVAVRLQAMTQDLSVPILVGPRLAATLPVADTVAQGEYLLEGLSRHSELFAPAAWAQWVAAAAGPAAVVPARRPSEHEHEHEHESGRAAGASRSLLTAARASGDL